MAKSMRAKVSVWQVEKLSDTHEKVVFTAVCGTDPFGPNGESEDNTYARYSPSATFDIVIANPELIGVYKPGQKFYVDFTPAEE